MATDHLFTKRWLIAGGIILLLILFALFVDVQALLRRLERNEWRFWLGGVALLFAGYAFNLLRWRYLLAGKTNWRPLFQSDSLAYMVKLITPIPIIVSRIVTTGMMTPVPLPQATSGMVVDRLLELLMRVLALIMVLVLAAAEGTRVNATTTILQGLGLFAVAVAGLVWLSRHREAVAGKLAGWLGRLPRLNEAQIRATLDNLLQSLAYSGGTRHLVIGFMISVITWSCFLGFQYLVLLGLLPDLFFRQLLLIAGVILMVIPPSTPAMIGVYHSIVIGVLLGLSLLDVNIAVAYAILLHLPQLVFWLVMGAWALSRANLKFSQLVQAIRLYSGSQPLNSKTEKV
jgi:hypothetical protein